MKFSGIFLALLALSVPSVFGQDDYVECIPGDINVIIAAPHGGDLDPGHIPDRDAGCYIDGECVWSHDCGEKDSNNCGATTGKDLYTQELTRDMREELHALFGGYPHVVINLLHRRKFDANRDLDEATFGVPEVEDAWYKFHECIDTAKAEIEANSDWNGMGLFFDNHGHGHPDDWAEMGYLLTGSSLDNNNYDQDDSAIRALGYYVAAEHGTDFDDLLRGDVSFGHFVEEEGYESVPSPTNPGPDGRAYFTGGYNTRRHGSVDGGNIDGIQIESARIDREDHEVYGMHLANAIHRYMLEHYPGTSVARNEDTRHGNRH